MSEMIRVEPAQEHRRCFARWAVAQEPKIRTADHNAFAVPADLFTQAPEEILIGALVDGHAYVPVQDGQESSEEDDDGITWAIAGEPLPPFPESAYGTDSVPLDFSPLEDASPGDEEEGTDPGQGVPARPDGTYTVLLAVADSDSSDPGSDLPEPEPGTPVGAREEYDIHACPDCEREFTTSRGRDTHRRQIHADSRS